MVSAPTHTKWQTGQCQARTTFLCQLNDILQLQLESQFQLHFTPYNLNYSIKYCGLFFCFAVAIFLSSSLSLCRVCSHILFDSFLCVFFTQRIRNGLLEIPFQFETIHTKFNCIWILISLLTVCVCVHELKSYSSLKLNAKEHESANKMRIIDDSSVYVDSRPVSTRKERLYFISLPFYVQLHCNFV